MSLASMLGGFNSFEGVSEETMAKYTVDSAAMIMAMECAELLNQAFMEGFYEVNDIEIEAAMEGYTSVTESSEKLNKIKEKLSGAWKKIAAAFRKMKEAVVGFFKGIIKKVKDHAFNTDKFIKSIPEPTTTITYKGFKYSNLNDVKDLLYKVIPTNFLGTIDGFDKMIGNVNENADADDMTNIFKENAETQLNNLKKEVGASEGGSDADAIWSYFRSGAKGEDDKKEGMTISVADVKKLVEESSKTADHFGRVCRSMEKDYEAYAKECEKKANGKDNNSGQVASWNAIATVTNKASQFALALVRGWQSAYMEALTTWRSAMNAAKSNDNKKE